MRLALGSSGLWPHVLLASVPCLFAYSPWDEGSGLQHMQAAMEEYAKVASMEDSLFRVLFPQVMQRLWLGRPYG